MLRPPPALHTVEIVAFPDVQLLDVTGPLQVFASANEMCRASGRGPYYAAGVVAKSSPVRTSSGLPLVAYRLPPATRAVDTLMVAGGAGVHAAVQDKSFVAWLARRATAAHRVASVCTGAWALAAAGVLDGKRAATHWADCEALARRHPKATVESEPIFLQDGKVWTSAGVTSGIDMALAMVESDIGHAIAMAVARDLVVFLKRPGGQSQFSAALELQKGDDTVDRLHGWVANNLAGDLSVPALAARARMSERTFLRYYTATTGQTPARAVEGLRVEAARQLLATTGLPIKRIAARCGFGSEETLRRSLLRKVGVTPGEYRARFSASGRK
ncbi:MAG TPA: GlxA family transcriptional regulator [Burkholderiales bacterium]|nr:GlxA family transcriptional regulator [Burkholderiales bacterium]